MAAQMPTQRIGAATVDIVPEFAGNPMPLAFGMPTATSADLEKLRTWFEDPDFGVAPEDSLLCLSWHTYLVQAAGRVVLIDTGLGNDKDRPDFISFAHRRGTDFLGRLLAHGVRPEDVDLVVCTHLHFDHVGWNTVLQGGRWVPTFPRARYVVSRADYEHFRDEEPRHPVNRPAFEDSVKPVFDAGLMDLVEPGTVLLDDGGTRMWLEDAAGHSPGSLLVRLGSGGEEAVFTGDLVHHPIQLVRPEINLAVEDHPGAAAATRSRLLSRLAGSGSTVFPAHFTGMPVGQIHRDGSGYRWEPSTLDNTAAEKVDVRG